MITRQKIATKLRQFREDSSGWVALEFIIMIPLLFWTILAPLQYFDAFRAELISTKATLTVADMLSRETSDVDYEYLSSAKSLLQFLSNSDGESHLRVTVFAWDEDDKEYEVTWSRQKGPYANHSDETLNAMENKLPILASSETAILVETWTNYEPSIRFGPSMGVMKAAGLKPVEFSHHVVTSPRFATSVCWNNTPDNINTRLC